MPEKRPVECFPGAARSMIQQNQIRPGRLRPLHILRSVHPERLDHKQPRPCSAERFDFRIALLPVQLHRIHRATPEHIQNFLRRRVHKHTDRVDPVPEPSPKQFRLLRPDIPPPRRVKDEPGKIRRRRIHGLHVRWCPEPADFEMRLSISAGKTPQLRPPVRRPHQLLADEHGMDVVCLQRSDILRCPDAGLRDKECAVRRLVPHPQTVSDIHREVAEIPVIDPDDLGAGIRCHPDLPRIMRLHDRGQSEAVRSGEIVLQLLPVQNRTDEQHCRGAEHLCLIDHVRIYGKILPEARDRHRPRNLPEIPVLSEEPLRLRQHRDCRSTGSLIILRDLKIRKLRCDQSLRGRGLLAFADKMHAVPRDCLFKPECLLRLRRCQCLSLRPHCAGRLLLLRRNHARPRGIRQSVKNRFHFTPHSAEEMHFLHSRIILRNGTPQSPFPASSSLHRNRSAPLPASLLPRYPGLSVRCTAPRRHSSGQYSASCPEFCRRECRA